MRLSRNAVGGRAPKCLFKVLVMIKVSIIFSPLEMFSA